MVSDEVRAYLSAIVRKGGLAGGAAGGAVGGRATVRKGLACLSPEKRREIAMKGVAARMAKKQ